MNATTSTPHVTVRALGDELAKAVELIMHPRTAQPDRREAYVACERFKDESPLCAQVGLYLASNNNFSEQVKHFGLQLMEHTVKLKWNYIAHEEKLFIKENAMKLLLLGVGPAEDTSLSHLKDALSRIIVEMIKREWPQQWTTLLAELSDACTKGEAQTELVLLVFLRLVEDVALLQTIESNQRRKDMYQALTNNMNDIFEFLLRLIELHVTAFRDATAHGHFQKANAHGRVVEVVLLTVTGFVEWVSINHITSNNGKLLHILCILLNDKAFQYNAAECLMQITHRRGQMKERRPLLMLFGEEPLRYIYTASQMLPNDDSGGDSGGGTNGSSIINTFAFEQNHNFLKKLSQVLYGLVQQLTILWGKDETLPGGTVGSAIQRPQLHLEIYLETVLLLSRHPSLNVAHNASLIWNSILKHEAIARDPSVAIYIPKVIEVFAPKIVKIPYPSSSTGRPLLQTTERNTNTYICVEYDCEEDFLVFFHRCRADFMEIFRLATLVQPLVTFSYCEQWLNVRLRKSAAMERDCNIDCSVHDPIYTEWEALVTVLDGVLSRILLVPERPSVASGLRLLEECLLVETENPLILSILLSCISTLFVFLSMSSCQITSNNCVAMNGVALLPRVLDKIFAALVFRDRAGADPKNLNLQAQQQSTTRSQACLNLRRHAAAVMVKLGHKYPLLLLPVFDQINAHVKTLLSIPSGTPTSLGRMERVTLQEALLLISNHFCDYERQTAFVGDILKDSLSYWMTYTDAFKSAHNFIQFVGLDKEPIPASAATGYSFQNHQNDVNEITTMTNRRQITDILYIVLGVIKRCTWPDDPDRAARGGFVIGCTELGNPIHRNPASIHIVPLLPHILALVRVLNELYKPEAIAALADNYKTIHGMVENDKKILMGLCIMPTDPLDPTLHKKPSTAFDKMQNFMTMLYDGCYHLMGAAGPALGRDLYQLQGIADALINSAFACLDDLPDYRLRPIVRVFFKPFVYSCPPAFYDDALLPVFAFIVPLMYQRLTARWLYITSLYETGQLNGEISDTQEVLDDMLNRSLTREYLDVLKVALVGGQIGGDGAGGGIGGSLGAGIGGSLGASAATMVNMGSSNIQCGEMAMDMGQEEHSMDGIQHARATQTALLSDIISDLGAKLLRRNVTSNYILMTLLSALSWNDGACNLRAVHVSAPVMRFLATEQLMDSNKAVAAFTAVLQGLQVHGQHEANQAGLITLGVQLYELLRPKFPILADILQSIPNVTAADVHKFDEKMSVPPIKGNKVDKSKKDLFKKLTSHLIGRSVNQLFRHDIIIANLPPLINRRDNDDNKNALPDVIDANNDIGLPYLFNMKK